MLAKIIKSYTKKKEKKKVFAQCSTVFNDLQKVGGNYIEYLKAIKCKVATYTRGWNFLTLPGIL